MNVYIKKYEIIGKEKLIFNVLMFLLIFFISSCSQKNTVYKSNDITGTWVSNSTVREIIFEEHEFTILQSYNNGHTALFTCCDTLSTGKWEIRGKLLLLNSDEFYNKPLNLEVKEETIDSDSIFFSISSPFNDRNHIRHSERILDYKIITITQDIDLLIYLEGGFHYSPMISYKKHAIYPPELISVQIYPTSLLNLSNIEIRSADTKFYELKDKSSNSFSINIPDFDLDYLTRKRLIDYYIELVDDTTLSFEGELYIKQ